MSYILDALRKADAQRERDPSRGIHAQPAAGLPAPPGRRAPPGWWGAAALALVGAGAAYVLLQRPTTPPPPPTLPVTGFVKLETPTPVVQVATELHPPAPPPLPTPAQRAPVKSTTTTLKGPPAVAAADAAAAAAPAASASTAAAPAAVPASTADRILNVADLPAALQGELPRLAISGGVHSENAAQRLLVVGGQLKSEGAELAPGLVLEQIRPRTAVLRYKGFRYSLPY